MPPSLFADPPSGAPQSGAGLLFEKKILPGASFQHEETIMSQGQDTASLAYDPNRRAFMRMLAASAAAAGPLSGLAVSRASAQGASASTQLALKDDAAFWGDVRKLFEQKPGVRYMNIGTAGSMPVESLNTLDAESRKAARESLSGYSNFLAQRKAIAAGYGCDADELVMSGNTSDGMCHALLGLVWHPGDEIVTTNHEHPGGNVPMALLQDRFGVVIKRVTLPVGNKQRAEDYVDLFSAAIGPKTKAMVFSAPTYKTGTMLPVGMLAKLAQEKGIVSICDGAHIPGMLNANFREMGVDFLAGAGHKWQCGPLGTGILYIRNKVLPQFNPRPLPAYFPLVTSNYPLTGGLPPRTTNEKETDDIAARIQSTGSRNGPVYLALAKSCEAWDRIGRAKIEAYTVGMSQHLKEKIAEKWGVDSLYSPKDDPRLACALTAFNPFRNPDQVMDKARSDQFVKRMLDEYGFVIRNVNFPVPGAPKDHYGVRVSTHLWSNYDDVNQLVDAMWELSGKMNAS
ncbi:MAG TPA: aminotransferase class V-fold PLP-dependent enzyme [Microvirga sp.]|nr:aminotransferase class V-fold PLP-dependent enzyme [Microvirga sp.]